MREVQSVASLFALAGALFCTFLGVMFLWNGRAGGGDGERFVQFGVWLLVGAGAAYLTAAVLLALSRPSGKAGRPSAPLAPRRDRR